MRGTLVNVVAVLVGSFVGVFFSRFLTERIKNVIMQGLGLSVLLIGFLMAFETQNVIIVCASLVLGGIVGELLDIERRLEGLGERLKSKFKSESGTFVSGFVTASLVFCVGAMAVVGALEEGIRKDPYILYAKSLLDGVAAAAFSSALGIGVAFSVITIFIYQGSLTLLGIYLERFLTDPVIAELSATGGLLIVGIGINLLFTDATTPPENDGGVVKQNPQIRIKVGNLLPALVFAVLIAFLVETYF
jgi:uncharacterized membrane protein YqgA involved in biofilm formation